MKKIMISLLLGVITLIAVAQENVYKMSAISIVIREDAREELRLGGKDGLLLNGLCRLEDSLSSNYKLINFENGLPYGKCYAYKDGHLVLEGNIVNGQGEGIFKEYFDGGGEKLQSEIPYVQGVPHGTVKNYYPNGNIQSEREYKMGVIDGIHRYYEKNGRITESQYIEGELVEVFDAPYRHNDSQSNDTVFPDSTQTRSATADYNGQAYKINDLNQLASQLLIYPQECAEQGIQGSVAIRFSISEQNQIYNIEVLSSPDKALTEETIRVLHLIKYKSAMQEGKYVKTIHTIQVIFRL